LIPFNAQYIVCKKWRITVEEESWRKDYLELAFFALAKDKWWQQYFVEWQQMVYHSSIVE